MLRRLAERPEQLRRLRKDLCSQPILLLWRVHVLAEHDPLRNVLLRSPLRPRSLRLLHRDALLRRRQMRKLFLPNRHVHLAAHRVRRLRPLRVRRSLRRRAVLRHLRHRLLAQRNLRRQPLPTLRARDSLHVMPLHDLRLSRVLSPDRHATQPDLRHRHRVPLTNIAQCERALATMRSCSATSRAHAASFSGTSSNVFFAIHSSSIHGTSPHVSPSSGQMTSA